ncbi:MAG: hypothetical protein FJ027_07745 [Candidatus Rokubacteria bacterium]|nr:hypothetical protein [Candidatus Rokubacteria bacterium]
MSTQARLFNYSDVDGHPVCPTCGRAILPAQGVIRVDDCMIHATCYSETDLDDAPCEPTP